MEVLAQASLSRYFCRIGVRMGDSELLLRWYVIVITSDNMLTSGQIVYISTGLNSMVCTTAQFHDYHSK